MGSADRPVVSVVIVNFNGGPLLSEAVRAVLHSSVPVEVFVSDNGSKDGSLTPLLSLRTDPRLRIIENRVNLGFSRGNNVALKQAVGDYVLLLNPDCLIQPDTLASMLMAMADYPQAVMAGCLIRNPDGTEQAGCRRSVPSPWRTLVRVLHLNKLFPAPSALPSYRPYPRALAGQTGLSGGDFRGVYADSARCPGTDRIAG